MLKRYRSPFYILLVLLGLILWPSFATAFPLTAGQQLQQAWHFAEEMGTYHYKTQVLQTTHPTEKLSNVGRSNKTQRMAFEGMMDKPNETMYLKMTSERGQRAIEMKVEAGVAYGRAKETAAWEKLDEDMTHLFAPNGDLLGYLTAAENVVYGVRSKEEGEGQTTPYSLPLTPYSFEINGPRYAEYMRGQMEAELQRKGELPAGLTLGTAKLYQTMRGHGEIWLNEQGLPVRQVLHLEFPPDQEAINWFSADITTDFSKWDAGLGAKNQLIISLNRFRQNPLNLFTNPLALIPQPYAPKPETLQQLAFLLGLSSLLIGLVAFTLLYPQSRKLYAALSLSVIFSMLVTPLMQGHHVQAFNERQQAKQSQADQKRLQQDKLEQWQADTSGRNFNPRKNPLSQDGENKTYNVRNSAQRSTSAATSTSSSCGSSTDTDSDGLSDNVECYELGTWTDYADTDSDSISDYAEATGFTDNYGVTWYLDPLNADSNGDGLTDGSECTQMADITSSGTKNSSFSYSDCGDTDGDKVPDVFDFDNDGDGVPDTSDTSPDYTGDLTTNSHSQINLAVSGYSTTTQRAMLVDFELRPTVYEHLYQTNNVLDWPTSDSEGQVTRVYDTTFEDEGYSSTKTDHGDMMLVPMLEIEIPAPGSNTTNPSGGLPILSSYTGSITNDTPLDSWLDTDALDEYSITVSQDEDDHTIYVYVPLQQVEDEVGETPVAWAGEMYYLPKSSSWGSNHQVRMVWLVNMLTDSCSAPDGEDYDTYCDEDSGHWTTSTSVVQSYYEDFYLTSLKVREDYGFKTAVMAQTDALTANYENYLWALGNDLQSTFVEGLLLDDNNNGVGDRRFDITEIVNRFDKGSAIYSTGNAKLWDIPNNVIEIVSTSYNDQITGLADMVDNTIPDLLASTYPSATASSHDVTLLIAREDSYKSVSLGNTTAINDGTANTVSINLTSLDQQTYASLNWSPYSYDGSTWSGADLETYLDELETRLDSVVTSSQLTTLLTYFGETADDFDLSQAGVISLAKNYYTSMYNGNTAMVKITSSSYTTSELVDDTDYGLDYNNDGTNDEAVMGIVALAAESMQAFFADEGEDTLDEINEILEVTGSVDLSWDDDTSSSSYSYVSGAGSLLGALIKKIYKWKTKSQSYGYTAKGLKVSNIITGLNLTAGALAAYQYLSGDESEALTYSISSIGVTSALLSAADAYKTYKTYKAAAAAADIAQSAKVATEISKSTKFSAFVGLVVDLAVASTIFGLTVKDMKPGSLAFNAALALFIATIIVALIVAVISATVIGALIMAVIGLIDGLIALICEVVGVEDGSTVDTWVCGGITGAITQVIAYLIYDQTVLVDLSKDDRLATSMNTPTIDQGATSDEAGFVTGNQLSLTMLVTNTISMNDVTGIGSSYEYLFGDFFTQDTLHQSAFSYALETTESDHHSTLNQNTVNWDSNNSASFSASKTLTLLGAGINKQTSTTLYLNESYNIPTLECWGFIAQYCKERSSKDTYNYDMSQKFTLDIFPETFAEFITLALVSDDSYRLDWSTKFPTLMDGDGDGLTSQYAGGSDPNDSDPDSDNDGLSDYWETVDGSDPENADSDNDDLTDYWEAFYGTNPYNDDTDGDNLADGFEQFHTDKSYPYDNSTYSDNIATWSGSWTIVYDYSSSNTALSTRVYPDPLSVDGDNDEIYDNLEYTYGYNPKVAETANVLSLTSAVQGSTIVKPGTSLAYTATVKNELDSRYALGLLQAEYPVDTVQTTEVIDTLAPLASADMDGSVTIPSTIASSQATSLTLRAGAEIEDLSTNRYLWLHMNDAANSTTFDDDSLLGHDATCSGSACPTANGNYLSFDGGDKLTVAYDSDFNDTSFSTGLWVEPTNDTSTSESLLFKGEDYYITLNSLKVKVYLSTSKVLSSSSTLTRNEWSHIMLTVDSSTATLYVNGIKVDSVSNPTFTSKTNSLYIGGYTGMYFKGYLDDVEIYDYTLSNSEVGELIDNPVLKVDMSSLTDESSLGNTLSVGSATSPTFSDDGAAFDQTHYITVTGSNLNLSGGKFTFAMWLKPKIRWYSFDTDAASNVFTSKSGFVDWQGVFGNEDVSTTSMSGNYPALYINGSGYLMMRFGSSTDPTSFCYYQTTTSRLTFQIWTHVIVSFDGSNYTFYINGDKIGSGGTNCSGKKPGTTSTFYIGRPNKVGYLYFDRVGFTCNGICVLTTKYDYNDVWFSGSANYVGSSTLNVHEGKLLSDESSHIFSIFNNGTYTNKTIDQFDLESWKSDSYVSNTNSSYNSTANLYWSLSNDYYRGSLDDFRLYNYAVDASKASDIYNESYYAFNLSLDGPPGQDVFSDDSDNEYEASCNYTAGTCPDTGLAGRDNQAVRFDGTNDYLTMSNPPEVTEYTQAAWIYPTITDNNYHGVMGYHNGSTSKRYPSIWVYNKTQIMAGFGDGSSNWYSLSSDSVLTANTWNHVAVTYDGSDLKLYVNGELKNTTTVGSSTPYSATTMTIGQINGEYFKGSVDNVVMVKTALDQTGISNLMLESPILNLHLDEDLTTTSFTDDTYYTNNATCSGTACPSAGDKGQMREAVLFDGSNDILKVADDDLFDLDTFSIGLWVKPSQIKTGFQPIIVKEDTGTSNNRNFGMFINPGDMKIGYNFQAEDCSSWKAKTSTTELNEDQWNHLMLTYDGSTLTLYINGVADGTVSYTGTPCHNSHAINIGNSERSGYSAFEGNIDEVTIYGNALTSDEVDTLYDYQAAWYDVTESHEVLVDADNPVVSLDMTSSYIKANPNKVLSISAYDATSDIASVEYSTNNSTWTAATADGDAWIFTYTPGSEGSKTLYVRATDSAGNSKTASKTFTVDNSGPSMALNSSYTSNVLGTTSSVTLGGQMTDSSSGVTTNTMTIELLDHKGVSVSGAESATVTKSGSTGTWSIGYPLTSAPYGFYMVKTRAEDVVGNSSSASLGPVRLDGYGPVADVTLTSYAITATNGMVKGTTTDQLYPMDSRVAQYHFEESSGATQFADTSGNLLTASCTNCPTVTSTGKYGSGLTFDGVNDTLTFSDTNRLDLASGSFTAMAWFNIPNYSTQRYILQQSDGTSTGRTWLAVNTSGQLYSFLGGSSMAGNSNITTNTWHHVALTYDGKTLRLYVDGELQKSAVKTLQANNGSMLIGANKTLTEFFQGSLDEVVLYDTDLSAEAIYDIANPLSTSVASVKARYRHVSGSVWPSIDPDQLQLYLPLDSNTLEDLSLNDYTLSCTSYCPTTQQTGKYGYGVKFDGSDDTMTIGSESNFDNYTRLTVAAWIKVDSFTKNWQAIITKGDSAWRLQRYNNTNNVGFSTTGLSNVDLRGNANINDGQWHHVAGVYDGSKKYIYVDGMLDTSVSVTGSLSNNNYDLRLGSNAQQSGRNFAGSMDEVVIFKRALNASEISVLANTTPWQNTSLAQNNANFTTWSAAIPSTVADGLYKIDLWATDSLSNVTYLPNMWSGEIDISYPALTFVYTNTGNGTAQVSCKATDNNLTSSGWSCPISDSYRTAGYETDSWFTTLFSSTVKTTTLTTTVQTVSSTLNTMTACDLYGHCITASPGPNGVNNGLQLWLKADAGLVTTTTGVSTWSDQSGKSYVAGQITSTNQPSYLSNNINGYPAIRFDGSNDDMTITGGLFSNGKVYSDVNVYLVARTNTIQNSTPFQEGVSPQRVSIHIPWKDNNLVFWDAGNSSGNYRLSTNWSPAQTSTVYLWSFLYSTNNTALGHKQDIVRNGQTLVSDTTASTFTGQGNNFTIGSSGSGNNFNGDIAELLVYTSGLTLTEHNLIQSYLANKYGLTLSSTTSSRERMAERPAETISSAATPTPDTTLAVNSNPSVTPRAARLKLNTSCNLMGVDERIKNEVTRLSAFNQPQKFYTGWDNEGLSFTWTGANWQGQGDLFIYLDTKAGGSSQAYNPYPATISTTAIFLPTNINTNQSMSADYLVWVREENITQTIVVTDNDGTVNTFEQNSMVGATLLSWDGTQWVEVNGELGYQFAMPQTDITIPFSLLGITNPASQALNLVAFASEEGGLKIWSSMPTANNLNSQKVIGALASDAVESFMLLKQYHWDSLAADICPNGTSSQVVNGRQARANQAVQFNGANLTVKLMADPVGVSYNLFDDNLIFAHKNLFPNAVNWQAEYSELCQEWEANNPTIPTDSNIPPPAVCDRALQGANGFLDPRQILARLQSVEHPLVVNRQTINYSLQVTNEGSGTANQVMAVMAANGPLHLLEGQRVTAPDGTTHDEYRAIVGTLAPGESKTIPFRSQVDLSLAAPTQPGQPSNKDWAKVMARVYDETGDEFRPLEELHLDHEVDYSPPSYVEIQQPTALIGAGEQTLSGFVVDQSAVPTIMLELNGQVTSCNDEQPTDNQWTCGVNLGNLSDGATVKTRVKARDKHGFESNWFNGPTLIADTTAPVITFSDVTSSTFMDTVVGLKDDTLTGVLSDNRYANRVEVCDEENCKAAAVLVDPATVPPTTYSYTDDPGAPIVIGKNNTCPNEQIRTITVLDEFIITDLDVGLNLAHPVRNDVVAFLIAPNGQREEIYSRGSNNANLDVTLNDAAAIAVNKDLNDHDVAMPYYDNDRRPFSGALYKFRGLPATGTWILRLCDSFPNADEGLYYRSQLTFRAATTPKNSQATWQYKLSWPAHVAQQAKSLTVYGYDAQGNRSDPLSLNFTLDTQRPTLTVMETSPLTGSNPLLSQAVMTDFSKLTLAGTVSDVYTPSMRLTMRTPNGNFEATRIDQIDGTWNYTDTHKFDDNGLYCLWVEARDTADNPQIVGPLALQVEITSSSIPIAGTAGKIYLPLLLRTEGTVQNQQVRGPHTVYLPLMTRGEGVALPPDDTTLPTTRQVKLYFVDPATCR